jgi:hypothetical protein
MLKTVLTEPSWQRRITPEDHRGLTPLIYAHVNPYGRFDLDLDSWIDFGKIAAWAAERNGALQNSSAKFQLLLGDSRDIRGSTRSVFIASGFGSLAILTAKCNRRYLMRNISATAASVLALVERLTAAALAVALFGENLSFSQ